MSQVGICRSTDGTTVAEVDLDDTTMTVAEIVGEARARGAALVWTHGGDPSGSGMVPMPGYAHLRARDAMPGRPLPPVDADAFGPLLARAYLGLWGHKWVDPTRRPPTDDSVVLCLQEGAEPIGLCRVWPRERLVDQPGVVPEHREPRRNLRLLEAACALLGPGVVDVDTWGESPEVLEAFASLGFAVTEQQPGWELRL